MKIQVQLSAVLLSAAILSACTPQPKPAETNASEGSINEEQTRKVLEHHWEAFKGNDLEGTMDDYAEECVLITPDKTYHGLAEIRANFVDAFKIFPKDSSTLTLNKTVVTGDVGYILWGAATPTMQLVYATDTFIIQNGKIVRQTYAGMADIE